MKLSVHEHAGASGDHFEPHGVVIEGMNIDGGQGQAASGTTRLSDNALAPMECPHTLTALASIVCMGRPITDPQNTVLLSRRTTTTRSWELQS